MSNLRRQNEPSCFQRGVIVMVLAASSVAVGCGARVYDTDVYQKNVRAMRGASSSAEFDAQPRSSNGISKTIYAQLSPSVQTGHIGLVYGVPRLLNYGKEIDQLFGHERGIRKSLRRLDGCPQPHCVDRLLENRWVSGYREFESIISNLFEIERSKKLYLSMLNPYGSTEKCQSVLECSIEYRFGNREDDAELSYQYYRFADDPERIELSPKLLNCKDVDIIYKCDFLYYINDRNYQFGNRDYIKFPNCISFLFVNKAINIRLGRYKLKRMRDQERYISYRIHVKSRDLMISISLFDNNSCVGKIGIFTLPVR